LRALSSRRRFAARGFMAQVTAQVIAHLDRASDRSSDRPSAAAMTEA
jgi:hypothetical protein